MKEFVKAVIAYHRKNVNKATDSTDLNLKFEQKLNSSKKKTSTRRRPSLARNIYIKDQAVRLSKASNLQQEAQLVEVTN